MSDDIDWLRTQQSMRATANTPLAADAGAIRSEILQRLLGMADDYRREDCPHLAIAIYLELAEKQAETPEGKYSRERLMDMAADYQEQGLLHHARSLYERLLETVHE